MRHEPYQARNGEVFTVKDRKNGGYQLVQRVRGKGDVFEPVNFVDLDSAATYAKANLDFFTSRAFGEKLFLALDHDD